MISLLARRRCVPRFMSVLVTLAASPALSPTAWAADPFPIRPVRILVNTAPGGLVDVTTRLVAERMRESLKQQVIVENRAGGDGLIGIRAAKAAPADGYTLLASAGTTAMQMALKQDPGYDLVQDFSGVGLLGRSPFLMVVEPNQPYKTVTDFVNAAKSNPGKISYASAGVGTMTHIAAEVFLKKANLNTVKLMHVPYKGNGAAMPDVLDGRVTTFSRPTAAAAARSRVASCVPWVLPQRDGSPHYRTWQRSWSRA